LVGLTTDYWQLFMLLDALHKVANHRLSLSCDEAREVMSEILRGEATNAQIAALLVALHMKGETVEEIVGFAQAIRAAAVPLQTEDGEALDLSWWTPAVPEAIPAEPSTSPPRSPWSSPARASELRSMATAASAPNAARPT
jgi:Glycosyl transferase family, helical bundle domain